MNAALDIGNTRPHNRFPGSRLIAWLESIMHLFSWFVQPKRRRRQARQRSEIRRLYAAYTAQGAFRTFDMMGVTRISPKRVVFTTDATVRDSIEIFGDWRRIGLDIEQAARRAKQESIKGQLVLFE